MVNPLLTGMKLLAVVGLLVAVQACSDQRDEAAKAFFLSYEQDVACGASEEELLEYFVASSTSERYVESVVTARDYQWGDIQEHCEAFDMQGAMHNVEIRWLTEQRAQVWGRTTDLGEMSQIDGIYLIREGNDFRLQVGE